MAMAAILERAAMVEWREFKMHVIFKMFPMLYSINVSTIWPNSVTKSSDGEYFFMENIHRNVNVMLRVDQLPWVH